MEAFSFGDTAAFLRYRLGQTAHDTLQEFIDVDVTASDLKRILEENQAYRDLLFRFVNQKTAKKTAKAPSKGKEAAKPEKEEAPRDGDPTFRLIHMLGMLGTRNLIVALSISRLASGKFPLDPAGKIELETSKCLLHALAAEDFFQRNTLEYPETAYAAGLLFDLSRLVISQKTALDKATQEYTEEKWKRAQRSASLAYLIAGEVTGGAPKAALAAGYLIQLGKVQMAARFGPLYVEQESGLDKNPALTPISRFLLERKTFGVTQEELGAHYLRHSGLFPQLVPAIRSYREHYLHKRSDPSTYRLALILWLADAMARVWKTPADEKDPVFQEFTNPAIRELSLSKKNLQAVMMRAMQLR